LTAKLDGTNGLLQQYDYQVSTTGFSYTFAAGTTVLVMNPAGTLATGTITMPAAPADGMTITVESTQQVTALTMSGNGGTIVGSAIQLIPNQPLSWVYRLANTTWYPVFGGAGRASALVSGTAVASTSGTSIDFTSIPSWVKRITVMLNGVSTSGTSFWALRVGTSSGIASTGYAGGAGEIYTVNNVQINGSSSEIPLQGAAPAAADTYNGAITIVNLSGNIWSYSGNIFRSAGTNRSATTAGSVTLSATLDRVRLTTTGGTDTFDAGTINILYEG